jgi:hypothetical protein
MPVALAPAPTFVPVQVTVERAEPVIEIGFSGGERLAVRAGASADLVRAAVSALRPACCPLARRSHLPGDGCHGPPPVD